MKLQISICLISLFLCERKAQPPKALTVPEFNRKVHKLFVEKDTAARSYFVDGYYTNRRGTILVSDTALLRKNPLLLDSLYIPLQGNGIDSIERYNEAEYEQSFVRVHIYTKSPYSRSGSDSIFAKRNLQLKVDERPLILRRRAEATDTHPIQLLEASCHQSGNGIRTAGMAKEFLFRILIQTDEKIAFDSVWVNHRCFKTYVANNRQVISNAPVEFKIYDTVTLMATAVGPYANQECASPTPYEGDALLRVLVNNKPYFITIKKFRGITIYNRL